MTTRTPFELIYGSPGNEAVRKRTINEKLNLREGLASHNELEGIKLSIPDDEPPSMFSFYINLCLIYQGINKLFIPYKINELKFHNLLKRKGLPEAIVTSDINLLRYCITNFVCESNSFSNRECLDITLYLLKLAYNVIEVMTKQKICMINLVKEEYTNLFAEMINETFTNYGHAPVPEEDWNTIDDNELKDALESIMMNRLGSMQDLDATSTKIETETRNMLHNPLNEILNELKSYKQFSLKILAGIKVAGNFGEGLVPNEVIEAYKHPLKNEKITTPRRLIVPTGGGRWRRRIYY